jgi:hypothetical protein
MVPVSGTARDDARKAGERAGLLHAAQPGRWSPGRSALGRRSLGDHRVSEQQRDVSAVITRVTAGRHSTVLTMIWATSSMVAAGTIATRVARRERLRRVQRGSPGPRDLGRHVLWRHASLPAQGRYRDDHPDARRGGQPARHRRPRVPGGRRGSPPSGLRLGEVCGVQVDDVGFLTRTPDVHRQVQRPRGAEWRSARRSTRADDPPPRWARRCPRAARGAGGRTRLGALALPRLRATAAPELSGLPLAAGPYSVRATRAAVPRSPPLLRLGAHCGPLRLRDGAARARPRERDSPLNPYARPWPSAEDRTRNAAAGLMAAAPPNDADTVRTGGHA